MRNTFLKTLKNCYLNAWKLPKFLTFIMDETETVALLSQLYQENHGIQTKLSTTGLEQNSWMTSSETLERTARPLPSQQKPG
jgi:hypothetical protein